MDGYLKKTNLKQDMLRQNNLLNYIMLILLFVSCNNKERSNETNRFEENYKEERVKIALISRNRSKDYSKIYQMANDSIKNWTKHKLKSYELYRLSKWHLDSLFCINTSGTKCIMALNYLLPENENHDGMDYLYGVKIRDKWFFFRGPNIMLFREAYGNPSDQPLTISQLQGIATQQVFRGYLKKSSKEEWKINDSFFNQLDYSNWFFLIHMEN